MPNKVNKGKEIKSNSDVFEVYLGTFIDNAFTWYSVAKYKDLKSAYKGFKNYVNTQLKYTDEELQKVWDTGRLDIELRQGNKLLNWVGIYSRKVASLDEKEEKEVEKGKIKKAQKKKKDSAPFSNALGLDLSSETLAEDIWKLIEKQKSDDPEAMNKLIADVEEEVTYLYEQDLISSDEYDDLWFWVINAGEDEDKLINDSDDACEEKSDGKVEIQDDEPDADALIKKAADETGKLIKSISDGDAVIDGDIKLNDDLSITVKATQYRSTSYHDIDVYTDINFNCAGGIAGADKIYGEGFATKLCEAVRSVMFHIAGNVKYKILKYTIRLFSEIELDF